MTTYRTGNHWGVTIVREGEQGGTFGLDAGQPYQHPGRCLWPNDTCTGHADGQRGEAELVAVVTNGDRELAERICALLNGERLAGTLENATGAELLSELLKRGELDDDEDGVTLKVRVQALRQELDAYTLESRRADYVPDDSCTCPPGYGSSTAPDPDCVVHQGRRARGPKPPNPPGCICDGSGRTCPRHGAVS